MFPLPTDLMLHSITLTNLPLAYLDPGTGSLIVQAIVGAFIGAVVALKVYWHKIKAFFFKSKTAAPATPAKPANSDAADAADAPKAPADTPT